jgi:hypothetical protein
MARPRNEKKEESEFYAWSNIYYGGETEERTAPNGSTRKIVVSRNIVECGQPVSQAQLGLDDDEWAHLLEGQSVRPYPLPAGTDEHTSAHRAVMRMIVDEEGEIDPNKLMALTGAQHGAIVTLPPAMHGPASEDAPVLGEDKPEGA